MTHVSAYAGTCGWFRKRPVLGSGVRMLGISPEQAVADQAGATKAGYVQRRQPVKRLAAIDLHIMAKEMCSRVHIN